MSSPPSETLLVAPEAVDIVWFSGGDSERFLNDLISQEITDMGVGESRRSFLLSPRGKLDFVFWVSKADDRFALVIEGGRGEQLASALSRFRIRVNVEIEVDSAVIVLGEVEGIDVSWRGQPRTVVTDASNLATMADEEYLRLRLHAGEPRWGTDIDESTIPHESGLVPLSVDFDKGCFLGQELVARIDSRGAETPRKVRRLELSGGASVGDLIEADGSEVGVLTSVAGSLGLGVVRREIGAGSTVKVGDSTGVVKDIGLDQSK